MWSLLFYDIEEKIAVFFFNTLIYTSICVSHFYISLQQLLEVSSGVNDRRDE